MKLVKALLVSFLLKYICNIKNRKRKGKLLPKNEEISGRKAHTNTWKLNWNILMFTDVFLDQKRVNVCGAVFTMCSNTFTLFWLRNTSVIIKIFLCAFVWRSLVKSFPFLFLFFLRYPYFLFHVVYTCNILITALWMVESVQYPHFELYWPLTHSVKRS